MNRSAPWTRCGMSDLDDSHASRRVPACRRRDGTACPVADAVLVGLLADQLPHNLRRRQVLRRAQPLERLLLGRIDQESQSGTSGFHGLRRWRCKSNNNVRSNEHAVIAGTVAARFMEVADFRFPGLRKRSCARGATARTSNRSQRSTLARAVSFRRPGNAPPRRDARRAPTLIRCLPRTAADDGSPQRPKRSR
ncbi:hypothetical protein OKW32_001665 [Paraburkholderia youngii]